MSNPGVIKLASLNDNEFISFPYRFVIEDNIGEAIHIHYKDIRLDFTIVDFLKFADDIEKVFEEMVEIDNFCVKDYDETFLVGIAQNILNIQEIREKEILLSEILIDTYDNDGNKVLAPLRESRVFKSLNGINVEDKFREQINYFSNSLYGTTSNEERIKINLESIKKNGYPNKNGYIVVNELNHICDGQHRAACLYYLYGDCKVKVKEFESKLQTEKETFFTRKTIEENEKSEHMIDESLKMKIVNKLKKYVWKSWKQTDISQRELEAKIEAKLNYLIDENVDLKRKFDERENVLQARLKEIERKENIILYRKK